MTTRVTAGAGAPLRFEVHTQLERARSATVHLPHGPVRTPVFMPGENMTCHDMLR